MSTQQTTAKTHGARVRRRIVAALAVVAVGMPTMAAETTIRFVKPSAEPVSSGTPNVGQASVAPQPQPVKVEAKRATSTGSQLRITAVEDGWQSVQTRPSVVAATKNQTTPATESTPKSAGQLSVSAMRIVDNAPQVGNAKSPTATPSNAQTSRPAAPATQPVAVTPSKRTDVPRAGADLITALQAPATKPASTVASLPRMPRQLPQPPESFAATRVPAPGNIVFSAVDTNLQVDVSKLAPQTPAPGPLNEEPAGLVAADATQRLIMAMTPTVQPLRPQSLGFDFRQPFVPPRGSEMSEQLMAAATPVRGPIAPNVDITQNSSRLVMSDSPSATPATPSATGPIHVESFAAAPATRPVEVSPLVTSVMSPPAAASTFAATTLRPIEVETFAAIPATRPAEIKQRTADARQLDVTTFAAGLAPNSPATPAPSIAATEVKPTNSGSAGALATEENKLVVAADPQIAAPKYHFLAVTEPMELADFPQTEATFVSTPESVTEAEIAPEGQAPCSCNPGCFPQCGRDCPYGPGQSGSPYICGVDCGRYGAPCCSTWSDSQCIPWSLFGPGEYVGPARPAHVSTYYLRVNDLLTLTFIESRKKTAEHYRIGVGDRLQLQWLTGANATATDTQFNREVVVQPDGTVILPLVGYATAAGKTIRDFQDEITKLFSKYQRDPQITVTPLQTNMAIHDILQAVIGRDTTAGQVQTLRVTPEGTIQAAGIGSVYVQGLTLDELRSELEARYTSTYGPGLTITPALTERATSYVFLGGEVRAPGRYTLEGPTTVMQAIAMAGGWNNGGNTRQVVVFRRDENWCLTATKINVRAPLYGNDPCPVNDVWLRDNDLVIVPKEKILCATDVIELYFTRGIYAVFPITYVYDFTKNSTITPIP